MKRTLIATLLLASSLHAGHSYAQRAQQIPLRNDRETVSRLYGMLSQNGADRRTIYGSLTVDLQADLWVLQLEEFLAANPRLTSEQHSLTMEAIGLLSSGVLQRRDSPSVDVATRASEEIGNIAVRAAVMFSKSGKLAFDDLGQAAVRTAVEALKEEGAQDRIPSREPATAPAKRLGPVTQADFDCNCNTHSDTCGFSDCVFVPQACVRKPAGCGVMWAEPCNGWCNI